MRISNAETEVNFIKNPFHKNYKRNCFKKNISTKIEKCMFIIV